jgi:magnesium-protoporphyrin IX monomethyl ester (oxidative) cyclase
MTTTTKKTIEVKEGAKETLLTPFYTTNFKEIAELDVSSNVDEIKAIVEEFRIDYNRDHFIRERIFKYMGFFDGKLVIFSLNFLNVHVQPNFLGSYSIKKFQEI